MRASDEMVEFAYAAFEIFKEDLKHPVDNVIAPILNGLSHGLDPLHHMIKHPLETCYHIALFHLDAATIIAHASQNYSDPELRRCREALSKDDSWYSKSCQRMQGRIDRIKKFGENFLNAPHPKKLEMACEFSTAIYVPGTIIKAIQGFQNHANLGEFNPHIYQMKSRWKTQLQEMRTDFQWFLKNFLDKTESIKKRTTEKDWWSVDQIREASQTLGSRECVFSYVIMPNGQFRAHPRLGHGLLANDGPIAMGGDIVASNGRFKSIDNRTGDYLCYLEANVIKHVFKGLGVNEVNTPKVIRVEAEHDIAHSIERGVRRGQSLNFFTPEPVAVVLTDVFHTHEKYTEKLRQWDAAAEKRAGELAKLPDQLAALPASVLRFFTPSLFYREHKLSTVYSAAPKDYSISAVPTALFRVRAELRHEKVDDCELADLKTIRPFCERIYIITDDERLLMTDPWVERESKNPHLSLGELTHQKHNQLMKKANVQFVRMAGVARFTDEACIIDNGSGHTRPFVDAYTTYYVLSIFKYNGVKNPVFISYLNSEKGDGILPENFVGYRDSKTVKFPLPKSSSADTSWNPLLYLIPAVLSSQLHGVEAQAQLRPKAAAANSTPVDLSSQLHDEETQDKTYLQLRPDVIPTNSTQTESRAQQIYLHAANQARHEAFSNRYQPETTSFQSSPLSYSQSLSHSLHTASHYLYPPTTQTYSVNSYYSQLSHSFNPLSAFNPSPFRSVYDATRRDSFGRDSLGYDWNGVDVFGRHREYGSLCSAYQSYRLYTNSELRSFSSTLYSTRLLSSYNSALGYSLCPMPHYLLAIHLPGGVQCDHAVIQGVKDSEIQALFDTHTIALRAPDASLAKDSLWRKKVRQLTHDLQAGIKEDAYPFFSLHFNTDKFMYPVLHPVYQDTLLGDVIGVLDFWMKGFLNGSTYSLDFIHAWHKNKNTDKAYLKQHFIDLKTEFKKIGIEYKSLREKMAECGLEGPEDDISKSTNAEYQSRFKTSFRIIGHHDSPVKHQNGLFLFDPKFRVECTIELSPAYQKELEEYKKAHGKYPESYLKLEAIYREEAHCIETQMPLLPLFREYFALFQIITACVYAFETQKTMDKAPKLPPLNDPVAIETARAYPPIALRQFQYQKIHLSMKILFDYSQKQVKEKEQNLFDRAMFNMFTTGNAELDAPTKIALAIAITNLLREQLPAEDRDEITIDAKRVETLVSCVHRSMAKIVRDHKAFVLDESETASEHDIQHLSDVVKRLEKNLELKNLYLDYKKCIGFKAKIDFVLQKINAFETECKEKINQFAKKNSDELKSGYASQRSQIYAQLNQLPAALPSDRATVAIYVDQSFRAQIRQQHPTIQDYGMTLILQQPEVRAQMDSAITSECARRVKIESYRQEMNTALSQCSAAESQQLQAVEKNRKERIEALSKQLAPFRKLFTDTEEKSRFLSQSMEDYSSYDETMMKYYAYSKLAFVDNNSVVGGCGLSLPAISIASFDQTTAEKTLVKALNSTHFDDDELFAETADGQYWMMQIPTVEKTPETNPISLPPIDDIVQLEKELTENPTLAAAISPAGTTLLYDMTLLGRTDAVRLLIQKGANVNHRLPSGLTSLRVAIQNRFEETALVLIAAASAQIQHVMENGENYLHSAIEEELWQVASALIKKGASLSLVRYEDGLTPWHIAVHKGNLSLLREIIDSKKIAIDAQTPEGDTALHIAAKTGDVDVIRFLLLHKANASLANQKGQCPLEVAISEHQIDAAMIFAEHATESIDSLLIKAAKNRLFSVCDVLLKKIKDKTVLSEYALYLSQCHEEARLQILQRTYYVATAEDEVSIETAIMRDDIHALRQWIRTNIVSDYQLFQLAAIHRSQRCLQLLLSLKLSIKYTADIETRYLLMDGAIRSGSLTIVEMVLPYCRDIQSIINTENQTSLMLATALGHKKIIEKLLKSGADILSSMNGKTALHYAVMNADIELLELFAKEVPINEWPKDLVNAALIYHKKTVLVWFEKHNIHPTATAAAIRSDFPTADEILTASLKPETIDALLRQRLPDFYSVLYFGIEHHFPIIIELLRQQPNFARFDHGETKLHLAIHVEDEAMTEDCLESLPVDVIADGGVTALMLAAIKGNTKLVALLLNHKANPEKQDIRGVTALHYALYFKHEGTAILLISALNHVDIENRDGNTPLMIAVQNGLTSAVRILLQRGADVTYHNKDRLTALHIGAFQGHHRCVALLLKAPNCDVNVAAQAHDTKNDTGYTPLHSAAQSGHALVCKMLITHGADYTLKYKMQLTPMDLAFYSKSHFDVVKLFSTLPEFFDPTSQFCRLRVCISNDNENTLRHLIALDIDVMQVEADSGRSALHYAAEFGANRCATILIDLGCAVDAIDNEGNTPLHLAAKKSVSVVRALLQNNADVDSVNHKGQSALLIAIEVEQRGVIVELILSNASLLQPNKQGVLPIVIALSKMLMPVGTMLTLLTQHIITQSEFIAEHEKLFFMPVIADWLRTITTVLNQAQEFNETPLHSAVRARSVETVQVLSKSARHLWMAQNNLGETPRMLADAAFLNECGAMLA